jgi:hypothetical protein
MGILSVSRLVQVTGTEEAKPNPWGGGGPQRDLSPDAAQSDFSTQPDALGTQEEAQPNPWGGGGDSGLNEE